MSRLVVFGLEAQTEYREAANWYERNRRGLGAQFVTAVRTAVERIRQSPEFYACVFESIREALLERFPYALYYRIEEKRIVVLAVYHTARVPSGWQSRG